MKLRSLWRTKAFNRTRLIRCKSQKSLEKMEERLVKMNKRVAVIKEAPSSNQMSELLGVDMSRIDVLLILDEKR